MNDRQLLALRTAADRVFEGYAAPRDRSVDDDAYILLLREKLTRAHEALQVARSLIDAYETAYVDAVLYCGWQIWASMLRHNGDPSWEYADGGERRV